MRMKKDTPELIFAAREDFRNWLTDHSETSEGVWLAFGKTKALVTLTANEALEEALCFGWIDGQMKSIDESRYVKYFAKRRANSVWSEKNKKTVERLRAKSLMTELGERAVTNANQSGAWETQKRKPITAEQIEALSEKLREISPAYENFIKMSPSVQRTYTMAFLAPKSEEARQRGFDRIVDRLNKNLKPM